MNRAKVQVLVTLDDSATWKLNIPIPTRCSRHLSQKEIDALSEAIPRVIESVMEQMPDSQPKKKK